MALFGSIAKPILGRELTLRVKMAESAPPLLLDRAVTQRSENFEKLATPSSRRCKKKKAKRVCAFLIFGDFSLVPTQKKRTPTHQAAGAHTQKDRKSKVGGVLSPAEVERADRRVPSRGGGDGDSGSHTLFTFVAKRKLRQKTKLALDFLHKTKKQNGF